MTSQHGDSDKVQDFSSFFVNEELVEFQVKGAKFKYKPTTGGDETDWLNMLMRRDESGNVHEDMGQMTKCKLTMNLKSVPFDKQTIQGMCGIDKAWTDLAVEEKWTVLQKLHPKILDEILINVNRIDNPNEADLKN